MPQKLPGLHVVTDDALVADVDFEARARVVLEAGGAQLALHLRGPGTSGGRLHALALALVPVGESVGAMVVVNDRVDVALLTGAHGVQLGGRSFPAARARPLLPRSCRVGVSIHGPDEAATAEREEADWAVVGTIYPTPSHPGRSGAGPERVRRCAEARDGLPLLAIGGVTPGRVPELLEAGAFGVAVMRGIWHASDPAAAVRGYLKALERESA